MVVVPKEESDVLKGKMVRVQAVVEVEVVIMMMMMMRRRRRRRVIVGLAPTDHMTD